MTDLPTRLEITRAAEVVHAVMPPTAQYRWPLLCDRLGTEVWVKHENHTPVGAFKLRGGLVYFDDLAIHGARPQGVISATRGNHGQSVAFAAQRLGLPVTIVVPHGNSVEKNAAMRALGAELVEHGDDFQASLEHARELAETRGLQMVPSFHPLLIRGVATYSMELFSAVDAIDVAYVPIGLGSGICGMLAVRAALGVHTEIVGVVSTHAPAYGDSFSCREPVERPVTTRLADGMACRTPVPEALELIWQGVDRVVRVTDEEVAGAMRLLYETTHNVSEGAGAAATAAAFQERERLQGKRVAVVISGGNVDRDMFAEVLGQENG
jgi:threonine dehydratase